MAAKPCEEKVCAKAKKTNRAFIAALGNTTTAASAQHFTTPQDCPLDRDELGEKTWAFLHTTAAYYPVKPTVDQKKDAKTFISAFSRMYPCTDCAEDFRYAFEVVRQCFFNMITIDVQGFDKKRATKGQLARRVCGLGLPHAQ